jgi:sterol desaturase/sphingolipid hydroxylase (fatty acid hydroxylase superfamily)
MDLILVWAIPGFLALIGLEVAVLRRGEQAERRLLGYSAADTRTSLTMGGLSLVVGLGWKLAELAILTWAASLSPWDLGHGWVAWLVALVGVDLMYYWDHRAGHEVRLLWAAHVVHHSSPRYNLSTALRQPWLTAYSTLFFVPVALLGVPAEVVVAAYAINLLYQFWIHTEAVDRLWAPVEAVFNTPSHHRVHHGSQSQYLDRNYAGILIVWDRLFGTFEPEGERVRYGLTKPLKSYAPLHVATHELVAVWRDVRRARSWRDRAGYLLRGPGWSPASP